MPPMPPGDPQPSEQRRDNGRKGARIRWENVTDRTSATAKARASGPAFLAWHARKIDPDGKLLEGERLRLAEESRQDYYRKLWEASKLARAARAARTAERPADGE